MKLQPPFFNFIIILLMFAACSTKEETCVKTNCADYTSHNTAQAAFDSNPECHGDLDADNDGIACEEPGNSITNCQNTSNCGCSGLNKSPCQASVCCKWIVGDGCECK